jgi:hypothetical protein
MGALIERRTTTAPTVVVGDVRVTPEARVVSVRLPFGAFVWNRPSSVVVERGGRVERVRIVDVTRLAQVGLGACVLATYLACRRWPGRQKGALK